IAKALDDCYAKGNRCKAGLSMWTGWHFQRHERYQQDEQCQMPHIERPYALSNRENKGEIIKE
ncbi:MAG: hypothetical protein ACRDHW_00960, partial [Ktedonobacteraceae bacterium]